MQVWRDRKEREAHGPAEVHVLHDLNRVRTAQRRRAIASKGRHRVAIVDDHIAAVSTRVLFATAASAATREKDG
jgi:hypothetical protein